MNDMKEMEFGKKYQVGNYVVIKKVRSLNKRELKQLRDAAGIPADVQKHLQRGGLPFIVVETVSGSWSLAFVCGLAAYALLDRQLPLAIAHYEEPIEGFSGTTYADFHHLFNMWYCDTSVIGDHQYQDAKANAFAELINRQKAASVSDEEDKKILDELKGDEEAKANIIDMAQDINKEGGSNECN